MLVHDLNPESMRTVPRVCPAGGDSVSAASGESASSAGVSQSSLAKIRVWLFQPPPDRPDLLLFTVLCKKTPHDMLTFDLMCCK